MGVGPRPEDRAHRLVVPLGLAALVVAPLVIGIITTRDPRWYPAHDFALIELRVRDVWSADAPLIGLAGRFGDAGPGQGSHPGPLAFYLLAGPYTLLGGSAWALQAGAHLLQIGAAGAALWLAWRRGGLALALGVAATIAVLAHAYGAEALGEPWLPYLPMLWFVAFVLAVWAVVDGDLVPLPVAVLAGSLCVQTHVSYAGTVGLAGALALVATVRWLRVRRTAAPNERRRDRRAALLAAAAGVLVWLPPLLDQLGPAPRNLSLLFNHFRRPPEPVVGAGDGLELFLVLLNPWSLLSNAIEIRGLPASGSVAPGVALLAVEVLAAFVAWRLRHRALLRLHAVLGVLVVAGAVSVSRIIGQPFNYLTLWAWAIAGLLLLAIGWTAAAAVQALGDRRPALRSAVLGAGAAALVAVTVGYTADLAVEAARVPVADADLTEVVAGVVPATVERLERGDVPGGGRDGRYVVTWSDPLNTALLAQPSFGVYNELERAGFDVGVMDYDRRTFPHRVVDGRIDGEIHYAAGADVRLWRARQDAVEVAYHDPRDADERAAFDELAQRLAGELRASGQDDLAAQVGEVAPLLEEPGLDPLQRVAAQQLAALGVPAAVFVAPPPPS